MLIYWNTQGFRSSASGDNILNDPPPVLYYASRPSWTVAVINPDGSAADLSGVVTWRAAVDCDLNVTTTPMCRTLSTSITVSGNAVTVPLECDTAEFLAAVNGKAAVDSYFELWGYDSDALPVFYMRFSVTASAVVDPDGGEPPEVSTGYITEAQARALIAGITPTFQYSADGSTGWHTAYTSGDHFQRMSVNDGSQWSAAYPIGRSGVIVDNVNYSFTTTAGQAAAVTISKSTLGIASDSEPQLSLWSVGENNGATTKTQINTASYTAVWTADSLTITYYTTWPAGDWIIKMS